MAVQISGNDITVPRDGSFTRNVTIGGTLTYEDVTNIDSVGLVTARQGIEIGASPGVAASISVDGNMIVSGISTFGGNVNIPDKILHSGDDNTSIRFPAADTFTVETGGSERVRVDSDGHFGVGMSPSGVRLDVYSTVNDIARFSGANSGGITIRNDTANELQLHTGTSDALIFGTNGENERARIESAGNVKIEKNLNVVGVCTATSFSGSGANLTGISAGITMMDQWSITSDNNKTNGQTIDTGWERSDYFFAQIGSGMSESSGVFTFPSTGIYLLMTQHAMNTSASYAGVEIKMSSDSGGSYSTVSYGQITNTNNGYHALSLHAVVDVQNASTYRVLLEAYNSANVQYSGDSNALRNGITFIRLGDT